MPEHDVVSVWSAACNLHQVTRQLDRSWLHNEPWAKFFTFLGNVEITSECLITQQLRCALDSFCVATFENPLFYELTGVFLELRVSDIQIEDVNDWVWDKWSRKMACPKHAPDEHYWTLVKQVSEMPIVGCSNFVLDGFFCRSTRTVLKVFVRSVQISAANNEKGCWENELVVPDEPGWVSHLAENWRQVWDQATGWLRDSFVAERPMAGLVFVDTFLRRLKNWWNVIYYVFVLLRNLVFKLAIHQASNLGLLV